MRNLKVLMVGILPAFVLCACSLEKSMDDMTNTTQQLKNDSDHLTSRTDDLESEIVGKESPDMQIQKLDALFGDGQYFDQAAAKGPLQPPSEPDLLLNAGVAIQAMQFQYWKGNYGNDISYLDADMEQSLEILFVHTSKHIPRTFEVNPPIPNRDYEAVGALGAKLDRVAFRYLQKLAENGLKNLSAYDVVMNALRTRGEVERHDQLPRATSMVLQWKADAIYMVQLRHNFLPMMVLGRMTNFQDIDLVKRGEESLGWLSDKPDLNAFDPEEIKTWTSWLNLALTTRQSLKDMCIEPKYNSGMMRIFSKVDFGQKALVALSPKKLTSVQKIQRDFAVAYTAAAAASTALSPGVKCSSFE